MSAKQQKQCHIPHQMVTELRTILQRESQNS